MIRIESTFSPVIGNTKIRSIDKDMSDPENVRSALREANEVIQNLVEDRKQLAEQLNKQKLNIQRGSVAGAAVTINNIIGGGGSSGGGTITTGGITIVQTSVTAGVEYTGTYSAPAELVGVPILFWQSEGIWSYEVLPPSTQTVSHWKGTPQNSGTIIYSYQLL